MSIFKKCNGNASADFSEELKKQEKKIVKDLKRTKGLFWRIYHYIAARFYRGPLPEISHNWLIINACAVRTVKYLEENCPIVKEKIEIMATIRAYLEMARFERDFANAWSYVNLAMSLLPLVANDRELNACKFLFSASEEEDQIPDKDTKKVILAAINLYLDLGRNTKDFKQIKGYLEHISKMLDYLFIHIQSPGEEINNKSKNVQPGAVSHQQQICCKEDEKRYHRYEQRLKKSQIWNNHNRQISLKLSLWRFVGHLLFLTLLIAVALAEIIHDLLNPTNNILYFRPYIYISILGFFGGGLSAFLTAREKVVRIPSYRLIRAHTLLRMIVGAAGAFVVFIVFQLLKINEAWDLLKNPYAFLGLGIVSGFSERLFIKALEKISDNLSIGFQDKNSKPGEGKETEAE